MINKDGLIKLVGENNVREQETLSQHTTFRIGGKARLFVTPTSIQDLEKVLAYVRESGEPYFLLGNGSNVLVKDTGYDGVVIATHLRNRRKETDTSFGLEDVKEISSEEFSEYVRKYDGKSPADFSEKSKKSIILSGSGILLSVLSGVIAKKGLTGFEFASGIPGTLGGAVAMNAGAYGGEIKDNLLGAVIISKDGKKMFLPKEELELGYRSSKIQKMDMVVLSAVFAFEEGNKELIEEKMRELNQRRREKQPLQYGSAGSTFKRPEGYFAGKLIEDAGLKGYRVGDVMVSEKHAGFVVNVGHGTYAQAISVIRHVQEEVKQKFGVELEPEVKIL